MKKRFSLMLVLGLMVAITAASELDWQRTGPSAGIIRQVVPDRAHPENWYLLEGGHGSVYRSGDNGESWSYTGLTGVQVLRVHSASSEVFAIRQNPNRKYSLWSSVDLGRTFQMRTANGPDKIFDHPSDPKILWGSGISNGYDLSVSYNRGANWVAITNLPYDLNKKYDLYGDKYRPDGYYLSSVLVSPLDPNTVYVSTEVEFPASCSGYYIDLELVSKNGGRSWQMSEHNTMEYIYDAAFPNRAFSSTYDETRILTSSGWQPLTTRRFRTITSVPGRPNELYGLYGQRQWISRDGGIHWSRASIGPSAAAETVQARTYPQGSFLAGTSAGGLYIVNDDQSWRQVIDGLREAYVLKVATTGSSSTIYALTGRWSRYLFRSLNGGQTWKNITELLPRPTDIRQSQLLVVNPNNVRHVFVQLGSRLAVSFDSGDSWRVVPVTTASGVFINPSTDDVYFAKWYTNHLFKSADGGKTVQEIPARFGSNGTNITSVAFDPYNAYIYVATNRGLFVSRDGGRSSEQIATDLFPDCSYCTSYYQVLALPQRGEYLAMTYAELFKSVNQGVTWRKLSNITGRIYPQDDSGKRLFAITSEGRLKESFDGGITWDAISAEVHPALAPPHEDQVTDITDPRHHPIYLATTLGMYRAR